jgi:hypothetical protein
MKKIISTLLMVSVFALLPEVTTPAIAAPSPIGNTTPELSEFKPCPAGTYRVRRKTRRGRRIVNSLIAGGIGAAVGGGVGGGKGALIGLGAGTGGYLTYRYVKTRNGRCVPRYVRRG